MVRLLHVSDLEGILDAPRRAAELVALVRSLDGPDAVVLGSGDNTAPGVASLATRGAAALALFDRLGVTIDTIGNHDLDYGLDRARTLIRRSPQRWVTANLRTDADRFAPDLTAAATTIEVADETLAVTGVVDPRASAAITDAASLSAGDPVAAVGEALAGVDADRSVVLSHTGEDATLAREHDLDAVLGGHVHEVHAGRIAGTLHTQPGANGHHVMELDLDAGTVTCHDIADADVSPDPIVRDRLREVRADAGLDEVVAHVDEPIERDRARTVAGECRAGNLVADAYRWAADADVALHNAGGLREGTPLAGAVTVADLVSLVPFDEPVAVVDLTGRELRRLLAEAYVAPHGRYRWTAHVSGCRLCYDTAERRVESVTVDGRPVAPTRSYRVATNAYLLQAAHEFPTLTDRSIVDRLDTQYEVLAAYARERGLDPVIEGRIRLRGERSDVGPSDG